MSQISPFTGSILQSPQVQRQQSVEKDRQLRQTAETTKNAALTEDQLDHQVESSEELSPASKDDRHDREFKRNRRRKNSKDSDQDPDVPPHLDVTA